MGNDRPARRADPFFNRRRWREIFVEVHQTVRDLQGIVLVNQMVGHIFRIENGLVTRFDIREAVKNGRIV
jgi:hypothetical protein